MVVTLRSIWINTTSVTEIITPFYSDLILKTYSLRKYLILFSQYSNFNFKFLISIFFNYSNFLNLYECLNVFSTILLVQRAQFIFGNFAWKIYDKPDFEVNFNYVIKQSNICLIRYNNRCNDILFTELFNNRDREIHDLPASISLIVIFQVHYYILYCRC